MNFADKNKSKYLTAPTLNQVLAFINELGVTEAQFERFYGIPKRTINNIKGAGRSLPAKFWHIVYEKITPTYGVEYYKSIKVKKEKKPRAEPEPVSEPAPKNELLKDFKNKLYD